MAIGAKLLHLWKYQLRVRQEVLNYCHCGFTNLRYGNRCLADVIVVL